MKRFFITFLLVLTTAFSVTAQIMDPVKWTFAINDLNDEEFELVATATIEPSYHVYSTTTFLTVLPAAVSTFSR